MPTEKHPRSLLLALALVLALATGAAAQGSYEEQEGDILLEADLDGDNEIDLGDDDGSGDAEIAIRSDFSELCWRLEVNDVENVTAAHIHEGGEDENGDPVVTLSAEADATSEGCATDQGDGLFQRIADDPEGFYVNVHSAENPGGAIRGQLNEQEDLLDDNGFFDDNGQQDDDMGDDEDDGTDADPQRGDDADTPAPGFALGIAMIAGIAFVAALRRRK